MHALLPGHALTVENGEVTRLPLLGRALRHRLDHTPPWFGTDMRTRAHGEFGQAASALRRAGRRLRLGRHRFEPDWRFLPSRESASGRIGFHGKFIAVSGLRRERLCGDGGRAAKIAADEQIEITPHDFRDNIGKVIYHLDTPVAGPGSFPQYMVSELAARHVKVVLGGQGGDEIFGGYARYLIAYLEQCLKAAIDGTQSQWQLRRHAGIDHPAPDRAAGVQTAAPSAFLEGPVRPARRALLPPDRSLADMRDEVDWSALDREGVFAPLPERFSTPSATCGRKPTSTR